MTGEPVMDYLMRRWKDIDSVSARTKYINRFYQ